ncbi:MAG TPA: GMC family oxidoreductase N-terminal domain-containing protein [Solirubrobacteraceae bacterium]|nr:GMC family oxidoreductase N-terminal domain-containing protein [Solirubrobacteraceae bacterium]
MAHVPARGGRMRVHAGERRLDADFCVVGAGAGGAVAAAELAEGGARVVVLEQGPWHDPNTFTARPPQMLGRLYRDGGQTLTLGSPPILLPLGRGLGGTTLVNSGTCFRTPPHVLERWARDFGLELDGQSMDACFERVERALSVATVTPQLAGANAGVARRGAERLGWSHGYLRRNARGCVGSGVCVYGCPTSAKQHTGITYIPRARAAGALIETGADVREVVVQGRRARGVVARDDRGRRLRVRAPAVILACGTIHTPVLMDASGIPDPSGQRGRNLSLHPATAALALMDEVVEMARGVPQSFFVDEFAQHGIMLETIAGPPAYVAASLPLDGAAHAAAMARYRELAQIGLMVSDASCGRVQSLRGRPLIRYDLDEVDVAKFRTGLGRIEQLFDAAGARDLKLLGFHPLGTARAHASAAGGVTDGDLAVHGVRGLYIADGSVVPSALGVNPQLTIMALATRLALSLLSGESAAVVSQPSQERSPCPS